MQGYWTSLRKLGTARNSGRTTCPTFVLQALTPVGLKPFWYLCVCVCWYLLCPIPPFLILVCMCVYVCMLWYLYHSLLCPIPPFPSVTNCKNFNLSEYAQTLWELHIIEFQAPNIELESSEPVFVKLHTNKSWHQVSRLYLLLLFWLLLLWNKPPQTEWH